MLGAFSRLVATPLSTLLTALVIGITLMLPTALHLLVDNVRGLSYRWEQSLQASLFLHDQVSDARGRELTAQLAGRHGVRDANYLSRSDALAEFRELSGFGEAIDLLDSNPLPAVIVVTPVAGQSRAEVEQLLNALSELPEVAYAKLDQRWLERLYAIVDILRRSVYIFAALLGFAVIVVIGNTIRLDIEARREEIIVLKLLGATDAFVRRPFLYTGLWYGLAGSFFALVALSVALELLREPVSRLAKLYGSDFTLGAPSLSVVVMMVAAGLSLGWLGAWWTVHRHLGKVQPS